MRIFVKNWLVALVGEQILEAQWRARMTESRRFFWDHAVLGTRAMAIASTLRNGQDAVDQAWNTIMRAVYICTVKFKRPPCKYILKRYLYQIALWVLASECHFYKTKTGCKFGAECSFLHCKVEDNQTRSRKRVMTKVQLSLRKVYGRWVGRKLFEMRRFEVKWEK